MTFRTLKASDFASRPVPERQWLVREFIPAGQVTLFGGEGGAGKSVLALQLAVAMGAGTDWLDMPVARGKVIIFSAEDDEEEIHRRVAAIARAGGLDLAKLADVTIAPMAEVDAVLAMVNGGSKIEATPLWRDLVALVDSENPALLVIDALADAFAGDENNRTQARQFIGQLRHLAVRTGVTVVAIAHPSLTGMASGSGLSGSTAWSNSVRSRLYLKNGDDRDPDVRTLEIMKANYARAHQVVRMRWDRGRFVREDAAPAEQLTAAAIQATDAKFLELVALYQAEGQTLCLAGPHSAPKKLARDPRVGGLTKGAISEAMTRCLTAGTIVNEEYGPPSKPMRRLVLAQNSIGVTH